VPRVVLASLGLPAGKDPEGTLRGALADAHALIVLDDGAAAAPFLARVAPHLSGARWLVTARAPLGVPGEAHLPVAPLAVPAAHDVDAVMTSDVARLFTHAARRFQPHYVLHAEDAPALARLARLVDGTPLGLEMAAAWTGTYALPDLANALEGTGEFGVRATLAFLWRQLSDPEARAVAALSTLGEHFTTQDAVTATGASPLLLAALADRALLRARGVGTYALPPLQRDFAHEHLSANHA